MTEVEENLPALLVFVLGARDHGCCLHGRPWEGCAGTVCVCMQGTLSQGLREIGKATTRAQNIAFWVLAERARV